jgi:hypothetical protein
VSSFRLLPTVRISTERLIALFGKYLKYMLYQKTNGRSREHRKPFCAYALLAFVFFFLLAELSIANDFISQ